MLIVVRERNAPRESPPRARNYLPGRRWIHFARDFSAHRRGWEREREREYIYPCKAGTIIARRKRRVYIPHSLLSPRKIAESFRKRDPQRQALLAYTRIYTNTHISQKLECVSMYMKERWRERDSAERARARQTDIETSIRALSLSRSLSRT